MFVTTDKTAQGQNRKNLSFVHRISNEISAGRTSERTNNFRVPIRSKAESAFLAWKRKKKKMTSYIVLKRPKKTFKKKSKKKKFLFGSSFFFRRILERFFFLGLDGNRFRLADLGGVEPLRKLIRQKPVPGRGLEV